MAGPWEQFQSAPTADPKADGPWASFHPETGQPLSWGQVAGQAISNLPSSAYGVAEGVAHAVMHPIDTAQGLYDVGKGAVSKVAGAVGVPQDPAAKAQNEAHIDALGQFFANRYGSMDQFKKTLATDPAGVAMDLSTVLSGGETALARIPGATRAANVVGKAAEFSNPVSLAGKAAATVGEPIAAHVVGDLTTGAGAIPIRQAARAGYEGNTTFTDNMRGNAPMSDTVDMAQSALGQMRQDRSAAYKANMASVNAAPGHVGYQPIYNALQNAEDIVNFKQGGVSLTKDDAALSTLQAIKDKVSQWRGLPNPNTVEAADALKQAIGDIQKSTMPGTRSRTVADSVYNAAKSSIVQQAPDYAAAMSDYANASDKISELQKTFSLGEKASDDTALRKLQSVMRNNVNTNYGQRTKLMDELAQYEPDLPNALAGQALSSATPRGFAKLGAIGLTAEGISHGLPALMNPTTLAAAPFFSPRLMGEAAYKGGQAALLTEPMFNALPSAAKAAYIMNALSAPPQQNSLSGGMGPRYDANGNRLPGQ